MKIKKIIKKIIKKKPYKMKDIIEYFVYDKDDKLIFATLDKKQAEEFLKDKEIIKTTAFVAKYPTIQHGFWFCIIFEYTIKYGK